MNQVLAVRPGTVDKKQKEELKKNGFIVVECADPLNDIKVINTYGDLPPDGLLACALESISTTNSDQTKLRFARLVAESVLLNLKSQATNGQ